METTTKEGSIAGIIISALCASELIAIKQTGDPVPHCQALS